MVGIALVKASRSHLAVHCTTLATLMLHFNVTGVTRQDLKRADEICKRKTTTKTALYTNCDLGWMETSTVLFVCGHNSFVRDGWIGEETHSQRICASKHRTNINTIGYVKCQCQDASRQFKVACTMRISFDALSSFERKCVYINDARTYKTTMTTTTTRTH